MYAFLRSDIFPVCRSSKHTLFKWNPDNLTMLIIDNKANQFYWNKLLWRQLRCNELITIRHFGSRLCHRSTYITSYKFHPRIHSLMIPCCHNVSVDGFSTIANLYISTDVLDYIAISNTDVAVAVSGLSDYVNTSRNCYRGHLWLQLHCLLSYSCISLGNTCSENLLVVVRSIIIRQ